MRRTFSGANICVSLTQVVLPSLLGWQFSGVILWAVEDIHVCLQGRQHPGLTTKETLPLTHYSATGGQC